MIPEDRLLFFSNLLQDIPIDDVYELFNRATEKTLRSGEIYIETGALTKKLAYIITGVIRTYAIKNNGDDATLLLRWEDQFIGSHDCILLNKPSKFIYQALEETTILEIDYTVVDEIMNQNPKYEPLRNFVLMSMLSGALGLIEDFVLLSAEERYLKLQTENFDIVNRVPGKYIASMLGITPVSLSRIRKRIAGSRL
jgi:CRP-like cAMP-binding protein